VREGVTKRVRWSWAAGSSALPRSARPFSHRPVHADLLQCACLHALSSIRPFIKSLCHAAFLLTFGARLPRWQTRIKSSSMRTTRSTTKKQLALAKSPLGRLVDQQASPLLKLILAKIPADDGFVVQLACEPLHAIIKERFATSGGVKTTVGGVVSSVSRFEWIRGWSDTQSQPGWLLGWNEETCWTIARAGGLDVLKHVREQGCAWDEWTCYFAAERGHLDVLKWARANGCPWDKYTCSAAAGGGHLDVLKWAVANGCDWDESTCSFAAQ
jgi:hypothetical protein